MEFFNFLYMLATGFIVAAFTTGMSLLFFDVITVKNQRLIEFLSKDFAGNSMVIENDIKTSYRTGLMFSRRFPLSAMMVAPKDDESVDNSTSAQIWCFKPFAPRLLSHINDWEKRTTQSFNNFFKTKIISSTPNGWVQSEVCTLNFPTTDQKRVVDKVVSCSNRAKTINYFKLGVLAYGEPGAGKSTLKYFLANAVGGVVIDIQCTAHGERKNPVEFIKTYSRINADAPKIVCIDEIDVIIDSFDSSDNRHSLISSKKDLNDLIDQILVLDNVLLLFTTNKDLSYFDGERACFIRDGRIELKERFGRLDNDFIMDTMRRLIRNNDSKTHQYDEKRVLQYLNNEDYNISNLESDFRLNKGLYALMKRAGRG